jgi:hypothetical protein
MLSFKKYYLQEVTLSNANVDKFNKKYQTNFTQDQLKDIFDRFNKVQPSLKNKDIYNYKDLQELLATIQASTGREFERNIKQNEVRVIVNNDKVLVVEPLTVEASKKYGAGTKWCTAGENNNPFQKYFDMFTLVYFIDKKTGEKFAIAYGDVSELNPGADEEVGAFEAFDEEDNHISYQEDVLDRFGLHWGRDINPKLTEPDPRFSTEVLNGRVRLKNGAIAYYKDGKLHREDGPAYVGQEGNLKRTIVEKWCIDGKFHREGGPAYIKRSVNGHGNEVTLQIWYKNNVIENDKGPAFIDSVYADDGNKITNYTWYKNGVEHRDGAPAQITKNDKGEIVGEAWIVNGKRDRKDGPAIDRINREYNHFYGKNINHHEVFYYQNDHIFRLDGPAHIVTDLDTGEVIKKEYIVNDVECYLHEPENRNEYGSPIKLHKVKNDEEFEIWKEDNKDVIEGKLNRT